MKAIFIVTLTVQADEIFENHLKRLYSEIMPPKGTEVIDVHVERSEDTDYDPNS
jgi:hypothetical protein